MSLTSFTLKKKKEKTNSGASVKVFSEKMLYIFYETLWKFRKQSNSGSMLGCTWCGVRGKEKKTQLTPKMFVWQQRHLFSIFHLPPSTPSSPAPFERPGLDILIGLSSTAPQDLASEMFAASQEIWWGEAPVSNPGFSHMAYLGTGV